MADITRQIELFNQAFSLAWGELVSESMSADIRGKLAAQIRDNIQRRIRAGDRDAAKVAEMVILYVRQSAK